MTHFVGPAERIQNATAVNHIATAYFIHGTNPWTKTFIFIDQ